ncbi:MAG TPA: hypothetical protein PK395_14000 [bacterium]|nr:hypothetical protein [bacterium]HQQ00960.1 hypothetical protein [bacterium]
MARSDLFQTALPPSEIKHERPDKTIHLKVAENRDKTQKRDSHPCEMGFPEWNRFLHAANQFLQGILNPPTETYRENRSRIGQCLKEQVKSLLPFPVVSDSQAEALVAAAETTARTMAEEHPEQAEQIRRNGRHFCEQLCEVLLREHLTFLRNVQKNPDRHLPELIGRIGPVIPNLESIPQPRLLKQIAVYQSVRSFLHPPELNLSVAKVQKRAGARGQRGNLWTVERKEKTLFLEHLADSGKINPPFTEEDLVFLVSQSSMDMLRKKVRLLESEGEILSPNRLKSNFARLTCRIDRTRRQREDFEKRKELLCKLGASPEQIEYISVRASFQTMKNLVRLSNGELAISDLMGGRRAIGKILRRQGRIPSEAEVLLSRYLIEEEQIDPDIAQLYARSRKNHSLEHLKQTIEFLKDQYRGHYRAHWGFRIEPNVLRRALELGLSRPRLGKRSLTARDYVHDLRQALSEAEHAIISRAGNLTYHQRLTALAPLREAIDYEADSGTKQQLLFIYEQFKKHGLCIPRDQLKTTCLKQKDLFPSPRRVQDALEILNGSYGAIAQHGNEICVSPEYLALNVEATG